MLEDKPHHKHLGITLQNNCKWDEHISNISSKINMFINCLRHFKYKLGRKAPEIMYQSFILPLFDYADVIWDNCTDTQSNILENLHLEAIRIITDSVRGTSHQKLYNESGFCTLKGRRKKHKLIQFYKMINNTCPDYLSDLLPPLVSTTNSTTEVDLMNVSYPPSELSYTVTLSSLLLLSCGTTYQHIFKKVLLLVSLSAI